MRTYNDISDFIFVNNTLKKADIIFLPGGSYPQMAEKAAQLYKQGLAPLIMPSGRYSIKLGFFSGAKCKADIYSGPYNTEYEFMEDVLLKNGVPSSAILKEDKSQYTYQNALFSREVTDKLGLKINNCIICCKSFHARRCLMYYEKTFPNAEIIICPVDINDISKDNWYKSEKGFKTVTGELRRCADQLNLIISKEVIEK